MAVQAETLKRYHDALKELSDYDTVRGSDIRKITAAYKINSSWYCYAAKLGYMSLIKKGVYNVNIKEAQPKHARMVIDETNNAVRKSQKKYAESKRTPNLENEKKAVLWGFAQDYKTMSSGQVADIVLDKYPGMWKNKDTVSRAIRKIKSLPEFRDDIKEYQNIPIKHEPMSIPPSIKDVANYCNERKNTIDPRQWYDYYEKNGWTVKNGKKRVKMKDWKAAVHTWEKNQKSYQQEKNTDQLDFIKAYVDKEITRVKNIIHGLEKSIDEAKDTNERIDQIERAVKNKLLDQSTDREVGEFVRWSAIVIPHMDKTDDRLLKIEDKLFPVKRTPLSIRLIHWWNSIVMKLAVKPKEKVEVKCAYCGRIFIRKRKTAVYCTDKCRVYHNRKTKKDTLLPY